MHVMFIGASAVNQDIGSWNVSRVTILESMFYEADTFNQDIGSWDVSNVRNMQYMFFHATSSNEDIGRWDESKMFFNRNTTGTSWRTYMFERNLF
jgi:surface protein